MELLLFGTFGTIAFLALLTLITLLVRWANSGEKNLFCTNCGFNGLASKKEQGSCLIEIILWLFVLPGLVYSAWRASNKPYVCPECGNKNLIPTSSLIAQKFLSKEQINN